MKILTTAPHQRLGALYAELLPRAQEYMSRAAPPPAPAPTAALPASPMAAAAAAEAEAGLGAGAAGEEDGSTRRLEGAAGSGRGGDTEGLVGAAPDRETVGEAAAAAGSGARAGRERQGGGTHAKRLEFGEAAAAPSPAPHQKLGEEEAWGRRGGSVRPQALPHGEGGRECDMHHDSTGLVGPASQAGAAAGDSAAGLGVPGLGWARSSDAVLGGGGV